MKTVTLISKRPQLARKAVGVALVLAGSGLALHAGLVSLLALSASAAAFLSLTATLLLALIVVAVAARMAPASLQAEPVLLAVPAARPWR